MDIKLGNLKFLSAMDHPDLMSSSVADAISILPKKEHVGVAEIDPTLSDTAAFCSAYNISMNQSANCVILEAHRSDEKWLAACVILGSEKADINGMVRRTLDARKVSFASMEKAIVESGMEYGAITPLGLPSAWELLVDQHVCDSEYVIIGSGIRKSKIAIPGNLFHSLPNSKILKDLSKTS